MQDFENVKDTGNWYFSTDSVGSKILSKSFDTDNERKSKVFHGKYNLVGTNNIYAWVLTGMFLRDEGWNLSTLDSISFYAKGSGQIREAGTSPRSILFRSMPRARARFACLLKTGPVNPKSLGSRSRPPRNGRT